jgi:predicted transcriptional regulator
VISPASASRNLRVPLPEALHRRLRIEAERSHRPATELAREAIDHWLSDRRRVAVHEAISAYAAAHAGTTADLDPTLEAAAIEQLVEQEPRAKGGEATSTWRPGPHAPARSSKGRVP